jgi:ATP-dependent DNA helicase RecQ
MNQLLKKYFGYDTLRPPQIPIIDSILASQDTLAIMPTGGGKSLCYQLPALIHSGITIVVCPLIALMHDQVTSLKENGIWAEYLNSSQSQEEQNTILHNLYSLTHTINQEPHEQIKLLYISPEKLLSNDAYFLKYLGQLPINLFAIDEAHCISTWGHEFRPEYTQLSMIKELYPHIPIIALTATADQLTRQDIIHKLGIPQAKVFISSFDRPNINYQVLQRSEPISQILNFMSQWPNQAGIIYCLSRKSTEEVAAKLQAKGIKALSYHAGMPTEDKNQVYQLFISDKIQVIVATIAFGMGIDKSNVRWVIHYNLPKNIESYYQETGRAGRDGLPSQALLLFHGADAFTLRDFIDNAQAPTHLSIKEIKTFQSIQHDKLNRLIEFSNTRHCRRKVLLQYFEETLENDCGNCDCCTNPAQLTDQTILTQKVLSAIARTKQRFGVNHIVDVLLGEKTDKVISFGHDNLPTFALLNTMNKKELLSYINQLVNLGIISIHYEGFMKSLVLNNKSVAILNSEQKVFLSQYQAPTLKVKKSKSTPTNNLDLDPEEQALFDTLRLLRTSIAEQEKVPPYIVFHDATLIAITKSRPTTEEQFLSLNGVGASKLKKYGPQFLEAIKSA